MTEAAARHSVLATSTDQISDNPPTYPKNGLTVERVFTTVDACFIATAAHGSKDHGDVVMLRRFRDRYLMTSGAGRSFVELYYEISPPIADFIRDSDTLRAGVRYALTPLVWLAREAMD